MVDMAGTVVTDTVITVVEAGGTTQMTPTVTSLTERSIQMTTTATAVMAAGARSTRAKKTQTIRIILQMA